MFLLILLIIFVSLGPLPDFPHDDAEMNGQVQYRGLPAPPHEAVIFEGDGMPPPCPREMYSQAGVYDVIPGDPVSIPSLFYEILIIGHMSRWFNLVFGFHASNNTTNSWNLKH